MPNNRPAISDHYLSDRELQRLISRGEVSGSTAIPMTPTQNAALKGPESIGVSISISNGVKVIAAVAVIAALYLFVHRMNPKHGPGYRPVYYGHPWAPTEPPMQFEYTLERIVQPDYPT